MELTQDENKATAADPQAMRTARPQKMPLSNNDPTRDISPRQSAGRGLLIGLVVLALLVMLVATIWAMAGR